MKTSKTIITFIASSLMSMGEMNYEEAEILFENIWLEQEQNYANIENMATNLEKQNAFSNLLSTVLGDLFTANWNHPSGQKWPIVDWNKVDGLDDFFGKQLNWIIKDQVIANTPEQLAKLQFAGSAIAQQALLGSKWFGSWMLEKVVAPDDNIKWLLFWYAEDFATDLWPEPEGGARVIDWTLWKQNFNAANDLGKAIILKNLRVLVRRLDSGWDEADDMHMMVFNGNNDALKAIALVKGDRDRGNNVLAKWKEIAENSTNAKLKNLAQEALEHWQIEIEEPE